MYQQLLTHLLTTIGWDKLLHLMMTYVTHVQKTIELSINDFYSSLIDLPKVHHYGIVPLCTLRA